MSRNTSLVWKVPLAIVGSVLGVVLLLLIAVTCVVVSPNGRKTVLEKGLVWANEKSDMDIDIGQLYLSPFHHSPAVLYRAYKGKEDLHVAVRIDSLFIGHRGQDTLVYTRALKLQGILPTGDGHGFTDLTSHPIIVQCLQAEETTFHSDSMIASVVVDVLLKHLSVTSPGLVFSQGQYPLHDLRIMDAFVGITLRPTEPDTTAKDTTPMFMAFDVPNGELRNIRFALMPTDLEVRADTLSVNVLADVGASVYDARRLDVGEGLLTVGSFRLPLDTLFGGAYVDLAHDMITSTGLHARSKEIGAMADLKTTALNLETMQVDIIGDADYQGSKACLRGSYDIDDEVYDMHVDVEKVDISPFIKNSTRVILAGTIDAVGKGLNLGSRTMRSKIHLNLEDAVYDKFDVSGVQLDADVVGKTAQGVLHLPFAMADSSLRVTAQTDHRFCLTDFLSLDRIWVDYQGMARQVQAHVGDKDLLANQLDLSLKTDTAGSLHLLSDSLSVDIESPMPLLRLWEEVNPLLAALGDTAIIAPITSLSDLTMLDTLRKRIPELRADIRLLKGSPIQPYINGTGLDLRQVDLALRTDSLKTVLKVKASTNDRSQDTLALRLPAILADMQLEMSEGTTYVSLNATSQLSDGAMDLYDLRTDANCRFNVERVGRILNGNGHLTMDSLVFGEMNLGSRSANIDISPSSRYQNALRADVQLDDIPLSLLDCILKMSDLDISGHARARAVVDGLPEKTDISANVLPIDVRTKYKPYLLELSLGNTPIVMEHNHVDFNGLPIYGTDSTFVALTGGLDLDSMWMDVVLAADSFVPTILEKEGPLPVYGILATAIQGTVKGPLDSLVADVDVTVLPNTDITYPLDEKNMAQVKPYGTIKVNYRVKDSDLNLGGRINVDEGIVRYSPKVYPIMPFTVDSGSHITFNGTLGQTILNASASQQVKADVQAEGQETRRVAFNTGVRVKGVLDSIGLQALDFFLEAPEDEAITRELGSLSEEDREGVAATLLATGMYAGQSNALLQKSGYALSSIVNSRINAAMANSSMGKVVDIDISSGETKHAAGKTNDMNIAISKTFLQDKLKITIGSTISDNPDVNNANGLLSSLTADYKLTNSGNMSLRLFSQRDYNNILEGELYKSGVGVRATKEWQKKYTLTADVGVAYRSNNSIGPNLTLKSSIRNLVGRGETFTLKADGAYYWALRDRHPGDPKKTDTYKLGVNASFLFPYLHWIGDNNPEGDTRYMLGYQYENIAGGYGIHKISGSFTYFIRTSRYVTHSFTPFSLSIVSMKAETDDLLDKAAEYPQLIKIIAGDEFVPSVSYNFTYNDYNSKRTVNSMFDLGVKESGNLVNAIYCIFNHTWDEKNKPLGNITFNQFVKLTAELRNRFNITDRISIATRLFAGSNIPLGNSYYAPLSEGFYSGGPNSLRASAPYAYGPGNFYSAKYNQNFFHAGDVKLEANFELRFPIVWKIYGATFVDAGNVWNWYSTVDAFKAAGYGDYVERLQLPEDLYDGLYNNPDWAKQIALGTGLGIRLDMDGLVVRLDLGIGIHAPYQTYRYDKDGNVDKTMPITTYYNIPSVLDALRLNFGIGYPF